VSTDSSSLAYCVVAATIAKMEQGDQADMAEFFNFAAASMPEENNIQFDLAGAFTTSEMLGSLTETCPVHPEDNKYAS
jgi:hypothetical protein